jgi:hypothetical protein
VEHGVRVWFVHSADDAAQLTPSGHSNKEGGQVTTEGQSAGTLIRQAPVGEPPALLQVDVPVGQDPWILAQGEVHVPSEQRVVAPAVGHPHCEASAAPVPEAQETAAVGVLSLPNPGQAK